MSMYPRSRFFPPQGQKNKIQSTYSYAQYPQNPDPAAVLIRSPRFGEVWLAPSDGMAGEPRAEEAHRSEPRPVLESQDIELFRGRSPAAIQALLEVATVFPGSRMQ